MLDSIGVGIIVPVLPDVVRRFVTGEVAVSETYGYFIAIYSLFMFLSSPFLGRLSDRFGRRPILLVALLGSGIDYFLMAFAPNLILLFLGRIVSGITGASFTVASAYIADISDDSNRSKNFGVIGAGFGLGFILGPTIGGLLAGHDPKLPFIAAGIFNLANCLFGYFVLPESLPKSSRRPLSFKAMNPFKSLGKLVSVSDLLPFIVVFFLLSLAGQTHPSIWTIYTQFRFGWDARMVGISLTVVGLLSAISQGGMTGILVKKFGERPILKYCILGQALSFVCYGLINEGWMMFVVLVAASVCWASQPALQSMISKQAPSNAQGELQGALMSLTSLSSIINPLVMTWLFAKTSNAENGFYLPGSPYFLGALLLFIAWIIVLGKTRRVVPTRA